MLFSIDPWMMERDLHKIVGFSGLGKWIVTSCFISTKPIM